MSHVSPSSVFTALVLACATSVAFAADALPSAETVAVALAPLSRADADQLVRVEAEAKLAAEAEHLERLDARPALERTVLDLGDRRILYNRTAPIAPHVQPSPTPAPASANLSSSADEAFDPPSKPQVFLMFSAMVYDGRATELRWQHEGRDYHAWSPINFNYFTGIGEFETAEAHYSYFMGISDDTLDLETGATPPALPVPESSLTKTIPDSRTVARPSPGIHRAAGYLVVPAGSPDSRPPAALPDPATIADSPAFAFFDAAHRHYYAHEAELQAVYQRRQTLEAAREAYLRAHPPAPRDTVINFAPSVRR